jgi:hypothetical protein
MKTASLLFFVLAIALISGCGSSFPILSTVHAQGTPASVFNGRYIFKSTGFSRNADGTLTPFSEGGTITADGQGHYTLDSWMNITDGGSGSHQQSIGTYTLDSNFQGEAQQTFQGCNCTGPTDVMQITMSADGRHGFLTSKDINFTWLAELFRD